MASTTYSTLSNQVPQLWSARLIAQAENRTFWKKFEGPEGSSMAIVRKDDLTKEAGDTIKMDMVLALTGAGVTGDTNALAGNEEALKFRQLPVAVSDWAHAVRWTEKAESLNVHDLRTTALNQLQKRLAGKLDLDWWSEFTGGGSTIPTRNQWFAGSATTVDTLADSDAGGRLKLTDISDIKAYAQATLKIEPMQVDNGEEYYGLALHPWTLLSLKKDTNYQQALREGQVRGDNNPLFTGAAAVWDGVILYSSNNVPTATNANTPAIQYAKNVFFGAQAGARAFAQYPDWREEFFDYGRSVGVATTLIYGQKASIYDLSSAGDGSLNTAIGHLVVNAAAVAPTA